MSPNTSNMDSLLILALLKQESAFKCPLTEHVHKNSLADFNAIIGIGLAVMTTTTELENVGYILIKSTRYLLFHRIIVCHLVFQIVSEFLNIC